MSLYRKYRPSKWSELVGHREVVQILRAAIESGNISHAYLFEGSRGTGKTSVARILAREIGTDPADLYEIDAASNRGIDEVRELREAVRVRPMNSKYKVYIIDEVHMLTTPAFNALLKTLEEPPEHCIFILATTERHKLPETIISRCQVFTFKRPSEIEVKRLLERVAKSEGYKIDNGALGLIALMAGGAYRDALTSLEKAILASSDQQIKLTEVQNVLGAPRRELVQEFVQALNDAKLDTALFVLGNVNKENLDVRVFTKLFMRDLRGAMLLRLAPDLTEQIKSDLNDEEFMFIEKLSKGEGVKQYSRYLREFLSAYGEISHSHIHTLPLELAVVRLLTP